jgi:micrococcal nuclease
MGLKMTHMKFVKGFAIAAGFLVLTAAAPRFEGGESGVVASIIDGDSFVLDSGLEVRLAQIEAPRVRPGDTWGPQATASLERMLKGKRVELRYGGLRRDRRGRAIAQVFIPQGIGREPLWVQTEMLKSGIARVHTYADNRTAIAQLWGAEREARRAGRGVWSAPAYQVRFATPEALQGGIGSFQLAEGRVESASQRGSVVFLNFGTDNKTDVTAVIPERAFALWPNGVTDLLALQGRSIRIRGYVRNSNGPALWLDHPEQIEYIMGPTRAAPVVTNAPAAPKASGRQEATATTKKG